MRKVIMENNFYKPFWAKITKIKDETENIRLFVLKLEKWIDFKSGQFCLVGIQGFGEAPFDICSPTDDGENIEIVVRKTGMLTQNMFELKVGNSFTFRGPYGNGFPALKVFEERNLLMIGGGTAIIVIRGLIQEMIASNFQSKIKPQVFYGANDWESTLFRDEFKIWRKYFDLHLILENTKGAKFVCDTGLITHLFEIVKIATNPKVIMCGPPIMYKVCVEKIIKMGILPKDIYLSLERRMYCGAGVCQHCAIGDKYVCKDGTIFTYEELKHIPDALL